ncbi:S-layer homology domain-containing protein [Candidatus Peregrinibacteria bacterium]|nr:MAG: S-layer homology domain-containing protein [Candidatus Peregrinibacteria bacterium]
MIRLKFGWMFTLLLILLLWGGYALVRLSIRQLESTFHAQQATMDSLRAEQQNSTGLLGQIDAYRHVVYALDLLLNSRKSVVSGSDDENPFLVFDYVRVLDDLRRLLPKDSRASRFQVTSKGLLTLPVESIDYSSLGRVLKSFKSSDLFTEVYIPSGMQRVPKQVLDGDQVRIEYVYTFVLQALLNPIFWQSFIPFSDVLIDAYYFDAVRDLVIAGSVDGYPDGLFRPDQSINRAEFFKIALYEGFSNGDLSSSEYEDFSDIGQEEWHFQYAQIAHKLGLVETDYSGRFPPDQLMTRLEVIRSLLELFDVPLTPAQDFPTPSPMLQSLDPADAPIILTARSYGLLDPFDSYFDPFANASRAETTYFLWRLKMDYLQ